jgi:2-haloalkanoic acid dehalogenase type II
MGSIRAISFDGDGTLWDFERVMRESLQHVLGELQRVDPEAAARTSVNRMIEIRDSVGVEAKGVITDLETIRLEAFRRTLQDIGKTDDALAHHLNEIYLKHRFEDIELFDDVLPVLKTLQTRYAIGLLSNGNSYPERVGLSGVFSFVVLSQDHGIEKPDPRIFQIALREAGCSKEQLLHVGDSLINDIGGAINFGIMCVWLNRSKNANSVGITPDFEADSLWQLLRTV